MNEAGRGPARPPAGIENDRAANDTSKEFGG